MRVLPMVPPPLDRAPVGCRAGRAARALRRAARANDTAPGASPHANVTRGRPRRPREVPPVGGCAWRQKCRRRRHLHPWYDDAGGSSRYAARATISTRCRRPGRPARAQGSQARAPCPARKRRRRRERGLALVVSAPRAQPRVSANLLNCREVAVEMPAHGLLGARAALVVEAHGDPRASGAEIGERDQTALLDVVGERPLDVRESRSGSGRRGCGT